MTRDQYARWIDHNSHMILPSHKLIGVARHQSSLHGVHAEALVIFTTTDMLIRAVEPGAHNPYLSFCYNLWSNNHPF